MVNDRKFKVLIMGAGRIGAFFDRPDSKEVLTHAHAFSKHPSFALAGFVDKNYAQAQKAAELWGGIAFKDLTAAFQAGGIDVVVNATPDSEHFNALKELINKPIKLIFTEKPLTATFDEAKKIVALARLKKVAIAVNYSRSWTPDFIDLKQRIQRGDFGRYLTGTGYYGKGFVHNGSHLINLLLLLFGDIKKIVPLRWDNDYFKTDPSLSGIAYLENHRPFFLEYVDSRCHTIFEADFIFSNARIRMTDAGFTVEYYQVKSDQRYAGYQKLELVKKQPTKLAESLYYAADNISQYLQGHNELGCSLVDGYKTLQTIFKTVKK